MGEVTHRFALLTNIAYVHNVFHVSMLRKSVANPSRTLRLEVVDIEPKATHEENPLGILNYKDKKLRDVTIPKLKVLWGNHTEEEVT